LGTLIHDWTEATLDRHRETLWRLAVLLYRRGRLTAPELDRALAPAAADPEPRAKLLHLAHTLLADPAFVWPVPAAGERTADHAGAGKRAPRVGDIVEDTARSAPER
jgi:hypothetical protein